MFDSGYWAATYMSKLPSLIWALIVLLVGWIVARMVGNGVEKLLRKTRWDEKIFAPEHHGEGKASGKNVDTNKLIGKIVFWVILIFVFILFFHLLNLSAVASPFMGMFGTMLGFIPALLKAALILLLAFVIASVLKMLIVKIGQKAAIGNFMKKMNVSDSEESSKKAVTTAGNIVFYLVMLLFIPGVLSALNIDGVAGPFGGMLQNMLAFIPKLLAAALILLIGWLVAKLIRDLVTGLLKSVGTEKFAHRLGLQKVLGDTTLSSVIGTIVFVLIMIPIVISALDQLQIRAITDPAVAMLNDIMTMIPNIVVAALLIMIAVWLGRWVRQIVAGLLQRVGFDSMTRNISLGNWKPAAGKMLMSEVVGYIAQILIVFFLTIEALNLIKLEFLVTMLTAITAYLPHVIAAVIILAIGLIIGNIVEKVLSSILSGPSFKVITAVAKYAIIALSVFMALDQLGVAAMIVNAAFILILGGLALAFGLAFGLGGKDFAKNYLAKLDKTIEQTNVDMTKKPANPMKPNDGPAMGQKPNMAPPAGPGRGGQQPPTPGSNITPPPAPGTNMPPGSMDPNQPPNPNTPDQNLGGNDDPME